MAQTRYFRDDEVLGTSQTSTGDTLASGDVSGLGTVDFDVDIVHNDSSTTNIGSNVATISSFEDGVYWYDATWSCPATVLNYDDKIRITIRMTTNDSSVTTETFDTSELNWYKLKNTTWTFYVYVTNIMGDETAYVKYGTDTWNSRITNIDYIAYQNIGLKWYDGSSNITIPVISILTNQKLRIYDGSTTYAIPLRATDDYDASAIRIYDGSNTKSLPKVL